MSDYIVTLMVLVEFFFTSLKFSVVAAVRPKKIQNYSVQLLCKLLNLSISVVVLSRLSSKKVLRPLPPPHLGALL